MASSNSPAWAGGEPVADITFRGQIGQEQDTRAVGDTGEGGANFAHMFPTGFVIVGEQYDVGAT
jgi:hypothetical protein